MNKVCLSLKIHGSGYCMASANHVIKGEKRKQIRFDATWAVIKHPTEGLIMFDTGYTRRFHKATKNFPNSIYANITKVHINKNEEAKMHVNQSEVKHIILSHLHADHVGGLLDFPNAQCWTSKKCIEEFIKTPKWRGFSKGLLHDLFPYKWEENCKAFEDCKSDKHKILGLGYDLFGDQSIVMYGFPGHAAGQHGALIQTKERRVLLAADAFWNIKAITHKLGPSPIVRLFFDDWKAYNNSLNTLRKFHKAHPEIPMIATHCPKTFDMIDSTEN